MISLLFTCPRDLTCVIGTSISAGERDVSEPVIDLARALDAEVTVSGRRVTAVLADPVDALLALWRIQRTLAKQQIDLAIMSFVASAASLEMLVEDRDPIRGAWQWVTSRLGSPLDDRGFCVIQHHGPQPRTLPVPDEISEQRWPDGDGMVVWAIKAEGPALRRVDRDGFVVGRGEAADLSFRTANISRRHLAFRRPAHDWVVQDLRSTSGFWIDEWRVTTQIVALQAGMVIKFAIPWAIVVLAT